MAKHEIPTIKAESRDRVGSRYAARLRQAGRLPAVLYGQKKDTIHVSVDHKEIFDLLYHHTQVLNVDTGQVTEPCLVRDVQWDPLGDDIVHVDLARINLTEKVTVEVELELHGEAKGLEETGAYLDNPVTSIEIECLATDIPDSIRVEVGHLEMNDTVTVGDIELPEGIEAVTPSDTMIATIRMATGDEEEEAEAELAEGAEPELIGHESEEGEQGEAPEQG